MHIRAKYCGGCNPEIDREDMVKKLGQMLGEPIDHFKPGLEPDLILFINGCARECVNPRTSGNWGGKAIVVAGLSIDAWPVSREEMEHLLFKKIKELKE